MVADLVDESQITHFLCDAIYSRSLQIVKGCLEALVCVIILVISKGIVAYVASKCSSIQDGSSQRQRGTWAKHPKGMQAFNDFDDLFCQ